MDHGFYHPSRGYWQVISEATPEVRSKYPEGTVETPIKPGPDHVWNGEAWVNAPVTREQALAALKVRRDEAMCAGIEVAGVRIKTDDISQQRLAAATLAAQIDPNSTVQWKTADGTFVTLTAQQITTIAMAVRAHVQACFDREADLAAQIRAAADPAAVALTF